MSLLGAALAVQIQDLVWLDGRPRALLLPATRADLEARADEIAGGLAMNPYYRCYEAADGFLAVACLNLTQRRAFLGALRSRRSDDRGARPRSGRPAGARREAALTAAIEGAIAGEPVEEWLARLGAAGVPAGPVLARETVHADSQVLANGLIAGPWSSRASAR